MSDLRRTLWTLALLTSWLVRRLVREGLVLRSLVWPAALTAGTLLVTVATISAMRPTQAVALLGPAAEDAELRAEVLEHGWRIVESSDHDGLLERGEVMAATDGTTLWTNYVGTQQTLQLEAMLRIRAGAPWRPRPPRRLPTAQDTAPSGDLVLRMLAGLFCLYGVVFGLGSVARDRDDGSLEAELTLPVPRWVPGLSRWIAATAVLSVFYALCCLLFDALISTTDLAATLRNGAAACGATTAFGLALVGTSGVRQSFSGPFAFALAATTGLVGAGAWAPEVGAALPVASLAAGGSGVVPLLVSLLLGLAAAGVFALRSGRS